MGFSSIALPLYESIIYRAPSTDLALIDVSTTVRIKLWQVSGDTASTTAI